MVVEAAEAVDVQGDAGALGEGLQTVGDHLAAEGADHLALETQLDDAVGAVRQVDHGAAEGLVQGRIGRAEAREARGGAQRLRKGVAQSYADIFGRVVVVDCSKRRLSVRQYGAIGRTGQGRERHTVKVAFAGQR